MSFLDEIKRRKVFQVAAVYLVVAWLIMQVVDVVVEPLRVPDWFATVVLLLLAIGFPIALILSWAFELTSDGVTRHDASVGASSRGGARIEHVLIGLLVLAVGFLFIDNYLIDETDQAAAAIPIVVDTPPEPEVLPNSVAVLPLENLGLDSENEFFAAGIHDTILNELAKIADLNVIGRTSMLRYVDGSTPYDEIARELNVETIMEGTVQYAEGQVRITAQLIDPATGAHLWSNNFDRPFSDIFAIQSEIARGIAAALEASLTPADQQRLDTDGTRPAEALELYVRARDWTAPWRDALNYLDEAIAIDDTFARAFAQRAYMNSFFLDDLNAQDRRITEEQILDDAQRALEIDPQLGFAHVARASVHWRSGNVDDGRAELDQALALSPNDPNVLDRFAVFHMQVGDPQLAIELAERAVTLDPGNAELRDGLGDAYFSGLQFENAAAAYARAADLEPREAGVRLWRGFAELASGDEAEALAQLRLHEFVVENYPTPDFPNWTTDLAYAYALLGRREDADRLIARARSAFSVDELGPLERLSLHLAERDRDAALRDYAEAMPGNNLGRGRAILANAFNDPMLDEPEFVAIRRSLSTSD